MKKMKPFYKFLTFIAIVVVIAILITLFKPLAAMIAGWFGTSPDRVVGMADTIKQVGIGIILVTIGIVALSSPILGISLVVIGAVILIYTLMPYFRRAPKV